MSQASPESPEPIPRYRARARRVAGIGLSALLWLGSAPALRAAEFTVAVAANFLDPVQALATEFERDAGDRALIVSGSTGQLYAQIVNGAPYEILLAADEERPRLLADGGYGDPASLFTYAVGRLALWSADPGRIDDETLGDLGNEPFRSFGIAVPSVAPYGRAARQVLENLGVWQQIEPRLVRGQNIAQTFAMVATGNAELGLVALSQALSYPGPASYRVIPPALHEPIRQDAILLHAGQSDPGAVSFLEFLRQPEAAAIIVSFGYTVPSSTD